MLSLIFTLSSLDKKFDDAGEEISPQDDSIQVYLNCLLDEQQKNYGYVSIAEKNKMKLADEKSVCTVMAREAKAGFGINRKKPSPSKKGALSQGRHELSFTQH